jgi:hypothetical protein
MSAETRPPLPVIMAALDDYAEELLHANDFYKITSYGWSDADTVDPEFSGHAVWQTSPPYEPDWQRVFDGGIPDVTPSLRDEALMLNGDDFTGAMLIARQSVGLALCTDNDIESTAVQDAPFWCHAATCLLWLGIASDRIREYFLITIFAQDYEQYFRTHKGTWASPFSDALVVAGHEEESSLLRRLEPLGQRLQSARKERHTITHRIATRFASRTRALLREQRSHGISQRPYPPPPEITFEELRASLPDKSRQEERCRTIDEIRGWYDLLAEVGNIVFLVEYGRRRMGTPGQ